MHNFQLSHGTQQLIDQIQAWTGVTPQCKAYPPQQRTHRNITEEFATYVNQHLNWTVEALIGYEPILESSQE